MTKRLSNGWRETTLGEVIDLFDQLRFPLNSRERAERQGPYPYYGASGAIDSVDDYKYDGRYLLVSEDGENLNSRKLPVAFFATGKFWVNNHAHVIRGKRDIADDYFLKAHFAATSIAGYVTGAAQPKLSQENLKRIAIRLPPIAAQRKIGGVLGAYDELIENNRRRIEILEEMARRLYREWFVQFRFPGHAHVPLTDSPLGKIPKGWEVVKLRDIAAVNRDSITKNNTPTRIRYVDIASVSPGQINKIDEIDFKDAPSRARRIVRHGDTIWSAVRPNRRSFAVILNPQSNVIVSTGFAVLTPQTVPFTFLHEAVTTDAFVGYLANHATGAAYPAVNAGDFELADLLVPPKSLLDRFHQAVEPMFLAKHNFINRLSTLQTTRDLLLPRLISGELDVSELPIEVEEAARDGE